MAFLKCLNVIGPTYIGQFSLYYMAYEKNSYMFKQTDD